MSTGFTPEQKAIVLFRDFKKCPICHEEATEVNHRANRGSGGYKAGNVLSNACAICSTCNGLIESDADTAILARRCGVKLFRDDIPAEIPYLHPFYKMWCLLDDNGNYTFCDPPADVDGAAQRARINTTSPRHQSGHKTGDAPA
jgi:hypothetical protein